VSICLVDCDKTADRMWMLSGIVAHVGSRMCSRPINGGADRLWKGTILGGGYRAAHCNQWETFLALLCGKRVKRLSCHLFYLFVNRT